MRKFWIKNGLIMVMLAAMSFTMSCDDDDENRKTSERSEAVEDILEDGTWQVTYFFEDDMDETSDFESFIFTFNADGTVQAISPNDIVDGRWSTESASNNGVKVNLSFPESNELFDELDDDWRVVEDSDNEIELMHESGGSSDTDYLTFTRVL